MIIQLATTSGITLNAINPLRAIQSELGNNTSSSSPNIRHLQTRFARYKEAHSQHNIRQHIAACLGLTSTDRLSTVPIHSLSKLDEGK